MKAAAAATPPFRPTGLRFWRAYAVTMRPYLLFVSGITGVAGMSLVPGVPPRAALVLGAVFFLSYGLGQALTDCFQTDTDGLSAPYRPLVRGLVRARDVLAVSLLGLAGCVVVLTAHHPAALVPAACTVVGLATYTWFKRRWWGGPWYNAWIVMLVALLGYLTACGAARVTPELTGPLTGTLGAAFFGYANFVLTGYYKDVEADRATGYRTLPVAFGRRRSAWVSDALAALALGTGAAAAAAAPWPGSAVALPFVTAATGATVVAQARLHRVTTDAAAHRAIGPVVHAYVLLLGGIAAAHRPVWGAGLAVFYLAFVAVLRRRPMAAQI